MPTTCTVLSAATFSAATAGSHPNVFVNQQDIEAIKAKVGISAEPWKSAYDKLMVDANRALSVTPRSVTDNGAGAENGNPHYFATDGGYSTDGVYNPKAERNDYRRGMEIGNALVDLGLAHAFTGDAKYAEKAVVLIRHWCLARVRAT